MSKQNIHVLRYSFAKSVSTFRSNVLRIRKINLSIQHTIGTNVRNTCVNKLIATRVLAAMVPIKMISNPILVNQIL